MRYMNTKGMKFNLWFSGYVHLRQGNE